ncbi:MAG TPA: peptidoglycan DD-metalloendopeptidase family protein [Clostridiales bacterium]|nr:peptidoglycan DD-metalloendopeptidase family protein [Clostridiales bacterium]
MKKRFVSILAFLLVLFMSTSVFASSLSDAKKNLDSISDDMKETKQELNEVKDEKESVRNQLNQLEMDLTSKEQELAAVENRLNQTQMELEEVKGELQQAEEELLSTQKKLESLKEKLQQAIAEANKQEELNASRLRAMYMNSSASYLELLLESKSLNDLLNRIDMIMQMVNYDNQVFDSMQQYRDEVEERKLDCEEQEKVIQEHKLTIEEKKAALEKKEQEIQASKKQIAKQKQAILNAQNEKEALINQLSEEEARILKELDQMERDSKALEKKIRELTKAEEAKKAANRGGSSGNGSKNSSSGMIWPVPGFTHISSYYGMRVHPIYKYKKMHTGIDISGGGRNIGNQPAVAVADGTVILSQYYGGYGNTVIIDHGGGITTLYAHGKSTTVSVGQQVKQGDTVLRIGSTGTSTGNHLHFEVRKNGSHTNPLDYVSR